MNGTKTQAKPQWPGFFLYIHRLHMYLMLQGIYTRSDKFFTWNLCLIVYGVFGVFSLIL